MKGEISPSQKKTKGGKMLATIAECLCGVKVYVPSMYKLCPSCNRPIVIRKGEPYLIENGKPIPLMTKLKFFPSHLKYFSAEYPKIGEKILAILEDGVAYMHIVWNNKLEEVFDNSKFNSVFLSWLKLD